MLSLLPSMAERRSFPPAWVLLLLQLICVSFATAEGLGVNWGIQATHRIPPWSAVRMLQDNGITKVKLFDIDPDIMKALAGTSIEATVHIPNENLADMTVYANAKAWVQTNVTNYISQNITIKYVAVGNEPFLPEYNGAFDNSTLHALRNVQAALNEAEAGVAGVVKATVPLNADVVAVPPSNPVPSAGTFRADITGVMTQMVSFLEQNGSPLMVSIYPFLCIYSDPKFPFEYAFFDGGVTLSDGELAYTNAFDGILDTLVAALAAAGSGDLPIVVGEVGWPTDGDTNASPALAQRFYAGLLKHLAGGEGTPRRPGVPIEAYMFGLFDEDAKSVLPGSFERHWGIFGYDGRPKYPMDLWGNSSNTLPAAARDVVYLSNQWCVLDPGSPDAGNETKVGMNVDYACGNSDCTSLAGGSSCTGLDAGGRASYSFNMYFQENNQVQGNCDFEGLAMVTTTNYSQGDCEFIIQLAPAYSSSSS